MRILLLLLLLLPVTSAMTLKEYYIHSQQSLSEKKVTPQPYLLLHTQPTQFRPSPYISRAAIEAQNDVFRLVIRHIRYPYQKIPLEEVKQVRVQHETIYDPLQKKTMWTKNITDVDLQKLLIRPDVRNALNLPALPPFKPSI